MRKAMMTCIRCGLQVRRKRLAQLYCSERCRNASVQARKRARNRDVKTLGGTQRWAQEPTREEGARNHLEAVTGVPGALSKICS